jgi:hypothetical protein
MLRATAIAQGLKAYIFVDMFVSGQVKLSRVNEVIGGG